MRPYEIWKRQALNAPILVASNRAFGCRLGPDILLSADGINIGNSGTPIRWGEIIGAYAGKDPKGSCGAIGKLIILTANLALLFMAAGSSFDFDRHSGIVVVVNKRRRWRFGHSKKAIDSALSALPPPIPDRSHQLLEAGADYEFLAMAHVCEATTAEIVEIINAQALTPD